MNAIINFECKNQKTLRVDLGDSLITVFALGKLEQRKAFAWTSLEVTEGGGSIETDIVTEDQITERITLLRGDDGLNEIDKEALKLFFN